MSTRRASVLREMGLAPLWRLREGGDADAPGPDAPSSAGGSVATPSHPAFEAAATTPLDSPITAAGARMGRAPAIPPQPAPAGAAQAGSAGPLPDGGRPEAADARARRIATLDWDALEADIHACRQCPLGSGRTQAVPGVGDRQARWMLVGEGPGKEEDHHGEPFVGQAGRLLDNMLAALALQRGANVYIANAVKCRPPHNRTPEAAEIGSCLPYLERQIELVKPRLLLALGRPAAQALLNTEISISRARGRIFDYKGIPVVVSYHPAYLLRNPQDKGKAWADLCFARKVMQQGS